MPPADRQFGNKGREDEGRVDPYDSEQSDSVQHREAFARLFAQHDR